MAEVVNMPRLGLNEDASVLGEWFVSEGDPVQNGDELFSIETDKSSMTVYSETGGTVRGRRRGQRLWLHHSSGRQSCAPGGSPGGNDAAAGDRYTDEIKHYGRTRFASFRGADAKRRAGRNSCDRRRGKRSAAGSPDPEHSRSGAQRSHQGFQEKAGRRDHRARPRIQRIEEQIT